MNDILAQHYASNFTIDLIRKFREEQTDSLNSLAQLVLPLRAEGGATLATQFSDYVGPTISVNYDAVVVLVIAGMNPAASRETMVSVRRFLAFGRKTGPPTHCLRAVQWHAEKANNQPECVESYKLIAIHFDSFCYQFCADKSSCFPAARKCSDPAASAFLHFSRDREAWCRNPCTRVIAHYKQGAAESAERLLPELPAAPTILNVDPTDQEPDPENQRVEVFVDVPTGAISLRLRIIHYEFVAETNSWTTHHRIFDTHTPETKITVGSLIAGRYYAFQVTAVNEIDEGPYSDIYPNASGLLVGMRTATIRPQTPIQQPDPISPQCTAASASYSLVNRAPNWLSWNVRLTFSELPRNQEKPASVQFIPPDGSPSFDCLGFELEPGTSYSATCKIPCRNANASSNLHVIVWDSNKITKIAEGALTHEPISAMTCSSFFPSTPVLCDVADERQRRCMVGTIANGSVCDACYDHYTPKTYRVSEHRCTGFQCDFFQRWCPLRGCITDSCDAGCQSGSSDWTTDAGGTLCALPCEMYPDVPSVTVAELTVPAGNHTKLSCNVAAGWGPLWDEVLGSLRDGEVYFHCPEGNTRQEYRVSEVEPIPACMPLCPPGTVVDEGLSYAYRGLYHGEELSVDCQPPYEAGTLRLRCLDNVVTILTKTCKAGMSLHYPLAQ